MSGPKGVAYQVVSVAELRRREQVALAARVAARRDHLMRVRSAVSSEALTMAAPAPVLASMSIAQLSRLETSIIEQEQQLASLMERERVEAGRAAVAAQMGTLIFKLAASTSGPARTARADVAPAIDGREQSRLRVALEVAAALDPPGLSKEVGELAKRASELGLTSAEGRALLVEIEARVTRADTAHRARLGIRRRVEEVEIELAGLVGSDATVEAQASDLVQRLSTADTRAAVEDVARSARALAAQVKVAADRLFALEQSMAVLEEMGYVTEVGEAVDGVIPVVATHDRWPNHGLRLVFRGDQDKLHTIPVAFAATDAADDVAFEEQSCDDISSLRRGLDQRGVTTRLDHHVLPGTLALRRQEMPARTRSQQQHRRTR